MSADNWAICPRCKRRHTEIANQYLAEANDAYDKVSREEWQALIYKAEGEAENEPSETLREDYEIYGAEYGEVIVSYSGHCNQCGLSLSFKHIAKFDGIDA